jgi:hypothetical protein
LNVDDDDTLNLFPVIIVDINVMAKHKQTVGMLLLLVSSMKVNAFVGTALPGKHFGLPTIGTPSSRPHETQQPSHNIIFPQSNKDALMNTQLCMSSEEPPTSPHIDDGTGRGLYILGIVFLACVWCFTVPPEFRRAYICSDGCAVNREAPQCNNCVTSDEWTAGVKDYYANGGGIQWDFSIDPNSKMKMF